MTVRRLLALLAATVAGTAVAYVGWEIGRGVWRYDPAMPWRRT